MRFNLRMNFRAHFLYAEPKVRMLCLASKRLYGLSIRLVAV
jgi:hypothetical protein